MLRNTWEELRNLVLDVTLKNSNYVSPAARKQLMQRDKEDDKTIETLNRVNEKADRFADKLKQDFKEARKENIKIWKENGLKPCQHLNPTTEVEDYKICMQQWNEAIGKQ